MSKCVTAEERQRLISEITEAPYDAGDSFDQAALFLLTAVEIGTDTEALANSTGLPISVCEECDRHAHVSGIFLNEEIYVGDWLDPETGAIAFMLDAMCVAGLMERTSEATQ